MPSTHDYEVDLNQLGNASNVELNNGNRPGSLILYIDDMSYLGQDSLSSLEYDYKIVGVEVSDDRLQVFLQPQAEDSHHIVRTVGNRRDNRRRRG